MRLVRQIHAVRRIPKLVEAEKSHELETELDDVSSEEDFLREHLNRSFKVDEIPV